MCISQRSDENKFITNAFTEYALIKMKFSTLSWVHTRDLTKMLPFKCLSTLGYRDAFRLFNLVISTKSKENVEVEQYIDVPLWTRANINHKDSTVLPISLSQAAKGSKRKVLLHSISLRELELLSRPLSVTVKVCIAMFHFLTVLPNLSNRVIGKQHLNFL